jgi:hypothetical protein
VATSHNRAVPSELPVARVRPSGLNATDGTLLLCSVCGTGTVSAHRTTDSVRSSEWCTVGVEDRALSLADLERVSYCRVVNAVRVGVARHCRAHQTTRLAVFWTAVPNFRRGWADWALRGARSPTMCGCNGDGAARRRSDMRGVIELRHGRTRTLLER